MVDIYTAFEGGGVKGIGLVGALAQLQASAPDVRIRGFAGTSAGAIVAALAAVGYPVSDASPDYAGGPTLETILRELNLLELLDGLKEFPLTKLKDLMSAIWDESAAGEPDFVDQLVELLQDLQSVKQRWRIRQPFSWLSLGRKYSKKGRTSAISLMDVLNLVRRLKTDKGIYGTRRFRKWLAGHLEARTSVADKDGRVTFGSLKEKRNIELHIVAADVGHSRERLFNEQSSPEMEIADAVLASMSLPLFFQPVHYFHTYVVDGGIVSNFPAWPFESSNRKSQQNLPIVGFRLVSEQPEMRVGRIESFGDYARAVAATVLDGPGFLQTEFLQYYLPIEIKVPQEIGTMDFDLTSDQKQQLLRNGHAAVLKALISQTARQLLQIPKIDLKPEDQP